MRLLFLPIAILLGSVDIASAVAIDVTAYPYNAASNWNGTTGTDASGAINQAISDVCTGSMSDGTVIPSSGGIIQVTSGGFPMAIASPIQVPRTCPGTVGIDLQLQLHAIAPTSPQTWDSGITTTAAVPVINTSANPPVTTLPGIWSPPSPWPSVTVTKVANLNGYVELTLSAGLNSDTGVPIATGQQILLTTGVGGIAVAAAYAVTVVDTKNVTIPVRYSSSTTYTTGATVYGPMPAGVINIASPSTKVYISGIVDCNWQPGCIGITDLGIGQAFNYTQVSKAVIKNSYVAGIYIGGSGAVLEAIDSSIVGAGDIAHETGWAVYATAGTADSRITHTDLVDMWQGFFTDLSTADINFTDDHIYTGSNMIGAGSGPYWGRYNGTFKGTGSYSGTLDSYPLHIITSNGTMPNVTIHGGLGEWYNGGLFDAPIIVDSDVTTYGGASALNNTRIGIDPAQLTTFQTGSKTVGWLVNPFIALRDPNGIIGSGVWRFDSLDAAAQLNTYGSTIAQSTFIISQASPPPFTGNTTLGSRIISAATLFPAIGAAVNVTCGGMQFNAVLSAFNYEQGVIELAPNATPSTACTGASVTIGSSPNQWTSGGGSVTAGSNYITGLSFNAAAIRPGVAISGMGIPPNSWLRGIAPFGSPSSPGSPLIEFDNATHTGATMPASGVSLTLTPAAYTLQPDDDGVQVLVAGSAAISLALSPRVKAGWQASINNINTSQAVTLQVAPGGNCTAPSSCSTLNGVMTPITIPSTPNGISQVLAGQVIPGVPLASGYQLSTPVHQ